jgi:hypothetical protein
LCFQVVQLLAPTTRVRRAMLICSGEGRLRPSSRIATLLRGICCLVVALSTMLRIKRMLIDDEIDDLIANTCAGLKLVAERRRRAVWQRTVANAAKFEAETLAT